MAIPDGLDETHDPQRTSWVAGADGHAAFPIQNLPYGIFSPPGGGARAGTAIGESILDLAAAAKAGLVPEGTAAALAQPTLNALFALSAAERRGLRRALSALLSDPAQRGAVAPLLHDAAGCTLHLPAAIGDYTDFYVGIHHATNVGSIYRPDDPLSANYKYLPVGYHGRASSIRASGTPVTRPAGQIKGAGEPAYGTCRNLDYELEMGVWIGPGNALGDTVPIAAAGEHVAGLCLLNDWSARDVQNWERLPLGPFLGKSFLTSVSPWVVTPDALAPFRVAPRSRAHGDPAPLPYLDGEDDRRTGQYAITLTASLLTPGMRAAGEPPALLSRSQARDMYWTIAQMIAHQTSNGCNLQPGDLLGTGTISPPGYEEAGSLMEITRDGRQPLTLPNGETRAFLEDGDEVILDAVAAAEGFAPIGFGSCRGVVQPARAPNQGH